MSDIVFLNVIDFYSARLKKTDIVSEKKNVKANRALLLFNKLGFCEIKANDKKYKYRLTRRHSLFENRYQLSHFEWFLVFSLN